MRILYLDIDALTPSHLSCYGYERNTSPTIDTISAEGLRCTNVYTSDAPCLPSRTAFYSGRLGIQTGVVGHGGTAAEPKREGPGRQFSDRFDQRGLAGQLQNAGFHTAMISPFGQRHAAHWFYAGFNEIHNTGQRGMEDAADVQPTVEHWLDSHASDDNWYLHVNYWDVHTPYRAPESFGNPFENVPLPAWLDNEELLAEHNKKAGPHSSIDVGMYVDGPSDRFPRVPKRIDSMTMLKLWIDGYDTAIRYVDDQIKRIVEKLKSAGVYEETAIIISADHGENQGEFGIYGEHGTADEGTCHIPMIIKWPGGPAGKVDPSLHYHLDLAPTLMDLLGRDTPTIWDGESYASTITSDTTHGRDQLVVSQCCHVCQRSVRWDNYLYIRTYHDGFHLFPREMLFDLAADPHELTNLAATRVELCKEGAWRLANWHDTQMQKMVEYASDVTDPMWTVMREGGPYHATFGVAGQPQISGFKKYLDRLEQTGRADGAKMLREKYASKLAK